MTKMDYLKKLGILGVSFGLMASPLAFAEMEGSGEEQEPAPQEEPMQEGGSEGTYNSYDTEQDKGSDVGTEYEEEEEEFTYEEEEEEQEVPTTDDEEDDSEW